MNNAEAKKLQRAVAALSLPASRRAVKVTTLPQVCRWRNAHARLCQHACCSRGATAEGSRGRALGASRRSSFLSSPFSEPPRRDQIAEGRERGRRTRRSDRWASTLTLVPLLYAPPPPPCQVDGPRVMLVGPTDAGKSTLTRILANYAIRMGAASVPHCLGRPERATARAAHSLPHMTHSTHSARAPPSALWRGQAGALRSLTSTSASRGSPAQATWRPSPSRCAAAKQTAPASPKNSQSTRLHPTPNPPRPASPRARPAAPRRRPSRRRASSRSTCPWSSTTGTSPSTTPSSTSTRRAPMFFDPLLPPWEQLRRLLRLLAPLPRPARAWPRELSRGEGEELRG